MEFPDIDSHVFHVFNIGLCLAVVVCFFVVIIIPIPEEIRMWKAGAEANRTALKVGQPSTKPASRAGQPSTKATIKVDQPSTKPTTAATAVTTAPFPLPAQFAALDKLMAGHNMTIAKDHMRREAAKLNALMPPAQKPQPKQTSTNVLDKVVEGANDERSKSELQDAQQQTVKDQAARIVLLIARVAACEEQKHLAHSLVADRLDELEASRAECQDLKTKLAKTTHERDCAQSKVNRLTDHFDYWQNKFNDADGRLKSLRTESELGGEHISELLNDKRRLEEVVGQDQVVIANLQSQVQALEKDTECRNQGCVAARHACAGSAMFLSEQLNACREELTERDNHIFHIENDKTVLENECNMLKGCLHNLRKEQSAREAHHNVVKKRVENLQALVVMKDEMLDKAHNFINMIKQRQEQNGSNFRKAALDLPTEYRKASQQRADEFATLQSKLDKETMARRQLWMEMQRVLGQRTKLIKENSELKTAVQGWEQIDTSEKKEAEEEEDGVDVDVDPQEAETALNGDEGYIPLPSDDEEDAESEDSTYASNSEGSEGSTVSLDFSPSDEEEEGWSNVGEDEEFESGKARAQTQMEYQRDIER